MVSNIIVPTFGCDLIELIHMAFSFIFKQKLAMWRPTHLSDEPSKHWPSQNQGGLIVAKEGKVRGLESDLFNRG
jgi:hypothetical protein